MELALRNRVAVVSASSQGIGRAIAIAFASEGAHLAICARNSEILVSLAREIREHYGVRVHAESLDVRQSEAIEHFVSSAASALGGIDICVTNAGGPPAKAFLATTSADWDDAFTLNLRSAADFAKACIPYMQRNGWGRIVTITSVTVRQPQPELVLSNAIRTGIMGLVRTLANDFAKDGITVNNVAPGYTATARVKQLAAQYAAASGKSVSEIEQVWVSQIPLNRMGRPEEIADAVVWLASERASFVTGQTLLVDGGMYKGL
jgi:3-oxoacyl-[acyl-carrier protein] reductase